MRNGATVIDPATTWIGVEVEIGRDVIIHPNTQLWGSTVIRDGAEIGPDTTLTDMEVGARATVVRTQGELGVIGEDATVGPFTHPPWHGAGRRRQARRLCGGEERHNRRGL